MPEPELEEETMGVERSPVDVSAASHLPRLTLDAAEQQIDESCFAVDGPDVIGAELEYLLADDSGRIRSGALAPPPDAAGLDGHISFEPGGQLELSSRPYSTLPLLIEAIRADLRLIEARLCREGLMTMGLGADPIGAPERICEAPRYVAMERFFAPWAPSGNTMMCSTASLQVNVHAGASRAEQRARWENLYAIGPVLAAAFANSSWQHGRRTRFKSRRLAAWLDLDPSRTGVPSGSGSSVESRYAAWALDAGVMMIRRPGREWTVPQGLTFRDWIERGHGQGGDRTYPTGADLDLHLSSLFPHIRPRGYFEIRFVDAQPGAWWSVPVAVITALCADGGVAEGAREACDAAALTWGGAARSGLGHPGAKKAALAVLSAAADRLACDPGTAELARQISSYAERWTARGLAPCDDPLPAEVAGSSRPCAQREVSLEPTALHSGKGLLAERGTP